MSATAREIGGGSGPIIAIVTRQLRHHGALLTAALAGLLAFEVLLVWIASSVAMGPEFQDLLRAVLPPAMQNLVLNQFGIASFPATVAFGFKHPFVIAAGATIVITMASIPAGERESGVLDLILARPVRRSAYSAAHVILILIVAVAFPIALFVGSTLGIVLTGRADASPADYLAPAAALAPLLLVIGGYTLLLAAGAQRRGSAVARAAGITLAFYVYEFVASMWDRLHGLEWLTIFNTFRPVSIVTGEAGWLDPLLALAGAAVLLGLATWRFEREG